MSSEKQFLALRLEGPIQSWGFDSQYNRRNTGLMPTKSAIAGMCCAALGWSRGSDEEKQFLFSFQLVRMIAIAIPKQVGKKELSVRHLLDYHTVGGGYNPNSKERGCITVAAKNRTPKAKNGQSIAVLTYRRYLSDASFGVLLEGDNNFLEEIGAALVDPVWGLWLGRKACIPSSPVFAGIKKDRTDALGLLIGDKTIESFTRQEEVEDFKDGRDSLSDQAVTFASGQRLFSPRRVRIRQAGEE